MDAYNHQSACTTSVTKLLQIQKEENWSLPLMYTVCLDLRLVAQQAEKCLSMNFISLIFCLLCLNF